MFQKICILIVCIFVSTVAYASVTTDADVSKKKVEVIQSKEADTIRSVVKSHARAVVAIHTFSKKAKANAEKGERELIYNSSLNPRDSEDEYDHGISSGVVISKEGYVVTTYDAVKNSDEVIVSIDSEHKKVSAGASMELSKNDYKAEIVKLVPELKLAFLKIKSNQGDGFEYLKLGNDSALIDGREKIIYNGAVVVGKAKGEVMVNQGREANLQNKFDLLARLAEKVSYRVIEGEPILCLESDLLGASVLPENSGGAVIDTKGRLLGLALFDNSSEGGLVTTVCRAIPISVIKGAIKIAIPTLIEAGREEALGIVAVDLERYPEGFSEKSVKGLTKNQVAGVVVESVERESIADEANLKPDDIILKFNNEVVKDSNTFGNMEKNAVGQQNISLLILRKSSSHRSEILEMNLEKY